MHYITEQSCELFLLLNLHNFLKVWFTLIL